MKLEPEWSRDSPTTGNLEPQGIYYAQYGGGRRSWELAVSVGLSAGEQSQAGNREEEAAIAGQWFINTHTQTLRGALPDPDG